MIPSVAFSAGVSEFRARGEHPGVGSGAGSVEDSSASPAVVRVHVFDANVRDDCVVDTVDAGCPAKASPPGVAQSWFVRTVHLSGSRC